MYFCAMDNNNKTILGPLTQSMVGIVQRFEILRFQENVMAYSRYFHDLTNSRFLWLSGHPDKGLGA